VCECTASVYEVVRVSPVGNMLPLCVGPSACGGPLQPRRRHGNERHGAHRKRLRVYEGKRVHSTRLH